MAIPTPARRRWALAAGCAAVLLACAAVLRPLAVPPPDDRALEFADRNGLPLGTILSRDGSHTAWVPLEQIAPVFVAALLSAEDTRFFTHGALDARAALRALLAAAARRQMPSGASTLSMQLARLVRPVAPGIGGRLAETLLAVRLENGLSKRGILEAYCNRAPMGGNVYGVEAAALIYFGVHAAELDLAQAAFLAAIPNDPAGLEPYGHWRALAVRRRIVLARMVATRRISADDARRAAAETVALQPRGAGIIAAPHLLFWLAPHVGPEASVVRTTVDRPLQAFVEEQLQAVVATLGPHDVRNAAALVVDNRSGDILAYAGSSDYFSVSALGRNDGVQALRQPGSALKPFLYELALERSVVRPNTVLLDAPVAYAIPGGRLYQPADYDNRFLGPVRVRLALANSLNVPAVRVLERVGVATFLARLRALGFVHLRAPADYYGLGLTLGGGEVSLYELTRAYATLARGGRPVELNALWRGNSPPLAQAARDPAWALVTDILADRHARAIAFGVDSILALPFPAAVKTGTSSDFRDTWTVGFTRDYTVGVWVGNFDGSPMRAISGVTGAGPLWNRIMLHLHERTDPQPFVPPAGYRRMPICATTGLRPTRTCATVVTEWLDGVDRKRYATLPVAAVVPRLAIAFPHDGDAFAFSDGSGPQQIDVWVLAPDGSVALTVDGRAVARRSGTFTWDLRPGPHLIMARRGRDVARARITVERPARRAREGFTAINR
jgi:penicillin-binding protein 1C